MMAVEKYLLDEFDEEKKDAFEDHFFSCDDCAGEIKAGAALLAHGREIFVRERQAQRELRAAASRAQPAKRDRFAWLWPNFAVPAMALMLGVLTFQNLVQFPSLQRSIVALSSPAVLPAPLYLASGATRGEQLPSVIAAPGQPFLLQIDFRDKTGGAHAAELYDSAGKKLWSLPVAGTPANGELTLQVPSGNLPAGVYSLAMRAAGSQGTASQYSFELHRP